jgi:hypothetical protein
MLGIDPRIAARLEDVKRIVEHMPQAERVDDVFRDNVTRMQGLLDEVTRQLKASDPLPAQPVGPGVGPTATINRIVVAIEDRDFAEMRAAIRDLRTWGSQGSFPRLVAWSTLDSILATLSDRLPRG